MTAGDRLFVPLAAAPHAWFTDGRKTWELRRRHRGRHPEAVRVGRRVELRRGDQDPATSLWGTIRRVVTADSIEQFFDDVPYQQVVPVADSRADAVEQASAILAVDPESVPVIGFEVEFDDRYHDEVTEIPLAETYRGNVIDGSKSTTVRRGHRTVSCGPARLVFRDSVPIPVVIDRVEHALVADLDDATARTDGFGDRAELIAALRTHYPAVTDDDPATVIHFRRQ